MFIRIKIILLGLAGLLFPYLCASEYQGGQDRNMLQTIVVNYDSVLYDSSNDTVLNTKYSLSHRMKDIMLIFDGSNDGWYYSFYLDGYDSHWSYWTENPVKEYTNLPSGNYTLFIRTGLQGRIISENSVVSWSIMKPLFLTPTFIVIYIIISILLSIAAYKLITRRHIRKQESLERLIARRTEELNAEKERTESLLANVLPKGTADELMAKGKATKKKYNFVTVLFSDIQGFTKIAEEVNPEVLIDELDKFFFYFDSVVEKHNIEKIKTIGDAYMCAGGIPRVNRTNPVEVILAALEMQAFMEKLKKEQKKKGQIFWDIRIGLHTGTVIAGVVGHKKLSYDIWGDTVNTASRMESSGEAGKINISGTTYDYARDFFICEYRGKMPVKYKGELDMYFVNGIRPELRDEESNGPNEQFFTRMLMLRIQDLEDEVIEFYQEKHYDKLVFHDAPYLKNIITQAELIARAEMLDERSILILRLAAIFSMTGYVIDYRNMQKESLALLRERAPRYKFREEMIDQAEDTLRQVFAGKPVKKEAMILQDAICDYFGRVDFIERLKQLYVEDDKVNGVSDMKKWYGSYVKKIKNHRFNTPTARLLRTNTTDKQLMLLKAYIMEL